jgi:hypothetical protein
MRIFSNRIKKFNKIIKIIHLLEVMTIQMKINFPKSKLVNWFLKLTEKRKS